MHGLGNDFVVVDLRAQTAAIDAAAAQILADRRTGIGCDQVILLELPQNRAAQAFMRIRNPDGSEAEACGNGTRCVAVLLAAETGDRHIRIETAAGLLEADVAPDGRISVDMGVPSTGWQDIPLAHAMDTLRADLICGSLAEPVCTNMGNPHATFFVPDTEAIDLVTLGPLLENDALFPQRANIGVATVRGWETIRLRVWERGAGLTPACGSGACAALVAANRRGLSGREAAVLVDGGRLDIAWREDGHVVMAGPAALSFEGSFDSGWIGAR